MTTNHPARVPQSSAQPATPTRVAINHTFRRDRTTAPRIIGFAGAGPGWCAIWRDESGEERHPVAAWALVAYDDDSTPSETLLPMVACADELPTLAVEPQWVRVECDAKPTADDEGEQEGAR